MTLAPERPCRPAEPAAEDCGLLGIAEMVYQHLPDYRAEILGGQLIVAPPADLPHGVCLTDVMDPLMAAKLHRGETRVVQGGGIWLPTGDDDYAIPDLVIVDADYRDHQVAFNCYDPAIFRLVLDITSSNWREDLDRKPGLYAAAGVPVYVIGDRQHREVVVLTDPRTREYRTRTVHRPGESFVLPESIGAKVELEVNSLLGE